MSTALYRRYRPETFADVIGQEHVTEPLMQALRTGRVNHAYLFSGPRGCGKTTSARILARCLNCEQGPTPTPCGECDSCVALARNGSGSVDVIEIDAASHGGVDDARDLREKASYGPAQSRYKVYIIDEAHMVTPQGFNALLKIVEEPPEHVKFIFATTEPDKVIGTIRSRTHHYPFRLVPPARLHAYMEQLCVAEGVAVSPGVLSFVTRAGGGSVRDSLSVLDQLIAGSGEEGLTYEGAASLLGFTDAELLDEVVGALGAGDAATVFTAIDKVIETGLDPRRFVEDLLERLRDLIVVAAVPDGAAGVLRGLPEDQVDRMRTQAAAFGAGALSRAADVVNAGLTEMTGATAPRLQLELIAARVLLPGAAGEQGYAARLDRLERRMEVGGVPSAARQDGNANAAPRPPAPAPPAVVSEGSLLAPPAVADAPPGAGSPGAGQPGAGQRHTSSPAPDREPAVAGSGAAGRAGGSPESGSGSSTGGAASAQPGQGAAAPGPDAQGARAPAWGPDAPAAPGAPAPAWGPGAVSERPAPADRPTGPTGGRRPSDEVAPSGSLGAESVVDGAAAGAAPESPRPPAKGPGGVDTAALRRSWPDVLGKVFTMRRTSWTLLSAHAQIADYDGATVTLSVGTPGLLATLSQGQHTEIVRQALIDVLGVDARVVGRVVEGAGGGRDVPLPSGGGTTGPSAAGAPATGQGGGEPGAAGSAAGRGARGEAGDGPGARTGSTGVSADGGGGGGIGGGGDSTGSARGGGGGPGSGGVRADGETGGRPSAPGGRSAASPGDRMAEIGGAGAGVAGGRGQGGWAAGGDWSSTPPPASSAPAWATQEVPTPVQDRTSGSVPGPGSFGFTDTAPAGPGTAAGGPASAAPASAGPASTGPASTGPSLAGRPAGGPATGGPAAGTRTASATAVTTGAASDDSVREEDLVSDDDEEVDGASEAGASVVERLLGGTVISDDQL